MHFHGGTAEELWFCIIPLAVNLHLVCQSAYLFGNLRFHKMPIDLLFPLKK